MWHYVLPVVAPPRGNPPSDLYTAHLPFEYLRVCCFPLPGYSKLKKEQAYPFAAFIVVHSTSTLDPRRSRLDLLWTNEKISRTDAERAVSRSCGYDLLAWLEDPDEGQTYTWSSETGPSPLSK